MGGRGRLNHVTDHGGRTGEREFDVCTSIHSILLQMMYMFIPQCNSLKALKKNPEFCNSAEHSLVGDTKFLRFLCLKVLCNAIDSGVRAHKS